MAPYRHRSIFGEERLFLPNLVIYGNKFIHLNIYIIAHYNKIGNITLVYQLNYNPYTLINTKLSFCSIYYLKL